jgi:hypothetical protein
MIKILDAIRKKYVKEVLVMGTLITLMFHFNL